MTDLDGIKFAAYCLGVMGVAFAQRKLWFPGKINSEEKFAQVVEEEKVNINFDEKLRLSYYFGKSPLPFAEAVAMKTREGAYEMIFDEGGRDRLSVRHELYHICAGHLDEHVGMIGRFRQEFSAWVYSLYGWKLEGKK